MDLITMDYESFYGTGYTLSTMTTEEYVRDPRFEAIMCSFKVNAGESWWVPRPDIPRQLADLKLDTRAVLSHHAHFDMLILNHHYGIRPKMLFDTLGMARALHGANGRLALAKLAERYGIGVKGTEVGNMRELRYRDLSKEQLARYGAYCCNDTDLTYELGRRMIPQFSREELRTHDYIIRMFTEPVMVLDTDMLQLYAEKLRAEKLTVMLRAGVQLEDLMSNAKFAIVLEELGIDPPMKISPTTGKMTYAFAKTDPGMQALQEHPDEAVQALIEARLKNKTTLAEKRAQRMVGMSGRGTACVYLKYSGASGTHRLSGGDKMNWQNFTREAPDDPENTGLLRKAVMAPDGSLIVVGDSSNIEARLLDWLAGQDDMVQVYIDADNGVGPDMYCVIAERIYKYPVAKKTHPLERQMGKVCVAEGTLVLCYDGWKPIEQVAFGDRVWDGEEWVWAQGSVCNGLKQTLRLCGIWLTPDHLVWSGTHWLEAHSLARDERTRSQALGFAAENLPLRGMCGVRAEELRPSLPSANAGVRNTSLTCTTLKISIPNGAISAHCGPVPVPASRIGDTPILSLMTRIGSACLTGCLQLLHAATYQRQNNTRTMGVGASSSLPYGGVTGGPFFGTLSSNKGGTIPPSTWTGRTTSEDMCRATSDLSVAARTLKISAALPNLKHVSANLRQKLRVYDVLNCGPRNRFTVLTPEGPLVVHNCKLGLGFGMGADKFITAVRGQAKDEHKKPLVITRKFSEQVVGIYRDSHPQVRKLWKRGEEALKAIACGHVGVAVDYRGVVRTCEAGLLMPGGLRILYPDLKYEKGAGPFGGEWTFWNGKAREHIYGAKLIENIIQCLARIIVMDQSRITADELTGVAKWTHSVHDEAVFVAPAFEAPYVQNRLLANMRIPPAWCSTLPLNSEGGIHQRYGLAK